MKLSNLVFFFLISTASFASLDGVYQTGCLSYSQGKAFKSEADIKGREFSSKFYLYDDKACQNLLLVVDYSSEVNYPSALDVGPMDHKVKNALMIVFDSEIQDRLNKEKLCGKGQVRVGTPVNIAGFPQCSPISVPAKGRILFDMYQKGTKSISFGAHPLLWVEQEEKRPVLTSRVQYLKK
jgi:hypothetical protein